MAGANGIPSTASAVIANVTVTNPTVNAYLTVWPAGVPQPFVSNLNFAANQTIPNLVTVKLGDNGQVAFAVSGGTANVVVDVVGYFDTDPTSGDLFNGVTPSRVLDTREDPTWPASKLVAGAAARDTQISGLAGVPVTASAVVANVTVTNPTAPAFLTVYPTGVGRPLASNLNFAPGQTIPNLVTVKLGDNGKVSLYTNAGATDVIVDVVGYFDPTAGTRFFPVVPARLLDGRVNVGATGAWGARDTRTVTLTGAPGTPANPTAVIANTTVTNPTDGSFLTVYPTGVGRPLASNLNFGPGQTIPNLVMSALDSSGRVDIYNLNGTVDVIADVVGYYAP